MTIPMKELTKALLVLVFLVTGGVKSQEEKCVHCPKYTESNAEEKEAIVYNKFVETEYSSRSLPAFGDVCESSKGLEEDIQFSNMFDRYSDLRPEGFARFFHFGGIVAKVKFESSQGHDFTGLFQGAEHGVMRFSPLAPLMEEDYLTNFLLGTFLFSAGIKLFRDGIHSGNFLVGDTPKGLERHKNSRSGIWTKPDWNIFSRPLHNMAGISDDLDPVFGEFEKFSGVLSVADVAAYDQFGSEVEEPKTPIIVQFNPNEQLKNQFGKGPSKDFRRWAVGEDVIPVGTTVYSSWTTVYRESGEASLCVDSNGIPQLEIEDVDRDCPEMELLKLGDVVLKSRFYASEWADEKLFFQHTRTCPKEQKKCEIMEITPKLTTPEPIFSTNPREFCLSDDLGKEEKTEGEIEVTVTCPSGSKPVGESCFPGVKDKVRETQREQCPFMTKVNKGILTNVDQPRSTSCSRPSQFFRNRIFTNGLRGVSWFMRGIERLLPFLF